MPDIFTVIHALTSCDTDWHILGDVSANDKDEAFEKAKKVWGKRYCEGELIVLSAEEVRTGVIVMGNTK